MKASDHPLKTAIQNHDVSEHGDSLLAVTSDSQIRGGIEARKGKAIGCSAHWENDPKEVQKKMRVAYWRANYALLYF